jgi:hypothetical protein
LGALSVGAKYALGAVVFGVVSEYMNAVGEKSGRDHFTFTASQLLSIPGKGDFFSFGNLQNRMFGDTS